MNTFVPQVGGDHYSAEYMHWDWAAETQLGYLEANATKYISRWPKKGGLEDLKKARSYVMKLIGVHSQVILVPAGFRPRRSEGLLMQFAKSAKIDARDVQIMRRIDTWKSVDDLVRAAEMVEERIDNPGWPGEDSGCE